MAGIGVAVAGTGYWGKNLVRNFSELGALRMVCDTNELLLEDCRKRFPGLETCLAFHEAVRRDDVDAVALATPAETHFALAREALSAGKHVLVEKPLALDVQEAEELIGLAARRGLVLMTGHLLQYHSAFLALKQLVLAGELGRIDYIYSHRLNLGRIRREENILWSFAPHDISMILSLAGEDPVRTVATGGNYLHKNIADVTVTHLDFPSGLKAHVFVSWLHPFKEQKLVVVGEKKMAVFDDTRPWPEKLLLYPHEIRWENNVPVPARAEPERVDIPHSEPLREECLHFLDCVENGRTPRTDGVEGLRVLRVLRDAQLSLDATGAWPASEAQARNQAAPDVFIHETAKVDSGSVVGAGSSIWNYSRVLAGSRVGERCKIGQNVVIGPDVSIGHGCKIQNNVSVYKGVTLEDEVFCGPSMVFTNVFNPRAHIRRMDEIRPTLVRKGATLGANCTIVCGAVVGRYAFVGAGAVVTRDVPDYALVLGNPARRTGWVCACGEKLGAALACGKCGQAYCREGHGLAPASKEAARP